MTYALFDRDNDALEELMHVVNPSVDDIVLLAALGKRYPVNTALGDLVWEIAAGWGMAEYDLNAKARQIWASGYRPGSNIPESIIAKGLL